MVDHLPRYNNFRVHSDRISCVLVAVPQGPTAARYVDADAVALLEYDRYPRLWWELIAGN